MGRNRCIYLFSVMPVKPINLVIVERLLPKRGEFNAKPNTSKGVCPSLVN